MMTMQINIFFFFNDTATTEIYTLSLHDALPISIKKNWNEVTGWKQNSAFFQFNANTGIKIKFIRLFSGPSIKISHYDNHFNNNVYEINNISSPVFIAASGPSLKESFPFLKRYSDRIILAALPSSLRALKSESIIPDLVIHTDPGFWAKEHLKYLPDKKIPIIMPLTSAFVPETDNPIILFNQGTETTID